MREDMFKVIVERPRWGSRHAVKSKIRYDKHKGRSHVTGRRLVMEAAGYTKHLNENLAPLRRYLGRQVGRRWDDVFSEICSRLDTGSTVKMHVREHLDDFVTRIVWRGEDGQFYAHRNWGGVVNLSNARGDFFVHPDDGTLQDIRTYRKKRSVKREHNRWYKIKRVSDVVWNIKLRGIWYRVELSNSPIRADGHMLNEVTLYESIRDKTWRDQNRWDVVKTLQLSKKALKAHGLSNDMEASYG